MQLRLIRRRTGHEGRVALLCSRRPEAPQTGGPLGSRSPFQLNRDGRRLAVLARWVGPVLAMQVPIAKAPLPNAQESVNDGLKRRFKERLQNIDVRAADESDESVAIASEWLRLRDSASEGQFGRRDDFFLGFLTGRCRVAPPEWWSSELEKGRVIAQGSATFPCRRIGRRWRGDEANWQFSGFDAVTASADKMTLRLGAEQVQLAKREDFGGIGADRNVWSHEPESAVAGTIDRDVCAVVFDCPTYLGGPREIHRVNSETGKLLWKSPILVGNLPGIGLGGAGLEGSFTEVAVTRSRIAVWVGHQFSMCFEIFDKADGKRLAIFATQYLDDVQTGSAAK